ncbi:unnamed protein product [Albugo candida]|uniref:Uncharacterized protein n=1 Tax=Albugo candida TaxID=65357 RepID=A0A024FU17_9STRA|nr:unnamed protein product [Albugo candida]|eukprot:CCI10422.1 unnamed protein product [Albugo candida]
MCANNFYRKVSRKCIRSQQQNHSLITAAINLWCRRSCERIVFCEALFCRNYINKMMIALLTHTKNKFFFDGMVIFKNNHLIPQLIVALTSNCTHSTVLHAAPLDLHRSPSKPVHER